VVWQGGQRLFLGCTSGGVKCLWRECCQCLAGGLDCALIAGSTTNLIFCSHAHLHDA
jgi:hypothetical protein